MKNYNFNYYYLSRQILTQLLWALIRYAASAATLWAHFMKTIIKKYFTPSAIMGPTGRHGPYGPKGPGPAPIIPTGRWGRPCCHSKHLQLRCYASLRHALASMSCHMATCSCAATLGQQPTALTGLQLHL